MLTVANHEGSIDSELRLTVQEKLSKNPQISRVNAGKYSWLTGLMKCGKCGYAVKINYSKSENKWYLICSGRSNFSTCTSTINIDLRELEMRIAEQIDEILKESPPEDLIPATKEVSSDILAIEQKIERLVHPL